MYPRPLLDVAFLGGSVVLLLALGVYAYRQGEEPGARPLAATMLTMSVWAIGMAMTLVSTDFATHLFWVRVKWFGVAFVPVAWLFFAASYTGYDDVVTPKAIALISIVPSLTMVFVWTSHLHDVMWSNPDVTVRNGVAVIAFEYGPWFWLNHMYGYILIGIASFLIVWLAVASDYLYTDQSILLIVGTVIPLTTNAMAVVQVSPFYGFSTAYAFGATGLAFSYALFRHRMLDMIPATRRIGRNAAIADLEDGVIILDGDRRVVYLNRAAERQFGIDSGEALGTPAEDLVDTETIDFDVPDALAEVDRDGRTYEVRTSSITDHQDRRIGYTLVLHDVTARKRRAKRLRDQRDSLVNLTRINDVIRGVNQAVVGATTREEVADAVCGQLDDSEMYDAARLADESGTLATTATDGGATPELPGDGGTADVDATAGENGTVGGPVEPGADDAGTGGGAIPDSLVTWSHPDEVDAALANEVAREGGAPEEVGRWTLVPVTHETTVYGALLLHTTRPDAFDERERAVLEELGETVGHAIHAVESRRVLAGDTVTELEFECGSDSLLGRLSTAADATVTLEGVVATGETPLVYLAVEDVDADRLADVLADLGLDRARVVSATEDGEVVEAHVTEAVLVALQAEGANVRTASATDGRCRTVAEVSPETDVRRLLERVQSVCPGAELRRKRDVDSLEGATPALPADGLDDLTDRQREVLEAAYRSGYFEWPRESTAEEVAAALDIASSTLHSHLRKAEGQLFEVFFERDRRLRGPEESDAGQ